MGGAQAFERGPIVTICFDLDGTLCTQDGQNYETAEPHDDRIATVRRLYQHRHDIVIYTARGMAHGDPIGARQRYEDLTREQLYRWGVPYHELRFGKPAADLYIDDRAISALDWAAVEQELARER